MSERRRPKGSKKNNRWIQRALRHNRKGRVRDNLKQNFGDEAFVGDNPNNDIKTEYLFKGKELAKEHGNRSLVDAYDFAIEEHEGKI